MVGAVLRSSAVNHMTDLTCEIGALSAAAAAALRQALAEAAAIRSVEEAMAPVSAAAMAVLGDADAPARPGALKQGERQFSVSGFFMLSPDGTENILIASTGFPEEQTHLRISATLGHPGQVVRRRSALLLPNTDEHDEFKQILKTARMGSAMYSPMLWQGRFLGQLITASQARYTYRPADHQLHQLFANAATGLFVALNGRAYVRRLFRQSSGVGPEPGQPGQRP